MQVTTRNPQSDSFKQNKHLIPMIWHFRSLYRAFKTTKKKKLLHIMKAQVYVFVLNLLF